MSQQNWIYTSEAGRRYVVGLYHGQESGHFMVHCNSQVVLIDFSVLRPASYTFFIDDELMEIHIGQKEDSGFTYDFKVNRDADTPKNRHRKALAEDDRKQRRIGILLAAGFFLIVFIAVWLLRPFY